MNFLTDMLDTAAQMRNLPSGFDRLLTDALARGFNPEPLRRALADAAVSAAEVNWFHARSARRDATGVSHDKWLDAGWAAWLALGGASKSWALQDALAAYRGHVEGSRAQAEARALRAECARLDAQLGR